MIEFPFLRKKPNPPSCVESRPGSAGSSAKGMRKRKKLEKKKLMFEMNLGPPIPTPTRSLVGGSSDAKQAAPQELNDFPSS